MIVLWLAKVWGWIKAAAKWLYENPVALAGALGSLVGALWMVRSKKNEITRLNDALEVQRIKADVSQKTAKADSMMARANDHAAEIVELRGDVSESKKRAAKLLAGGELEGKSDEEIAKLLSDAGL